jgi:predicted Zn-dependent protease with MMP-like domain
VAVEEEPTDEDYDETDTPEQEELFGIFRGLGYSRGRRGGPAFRPDRDLSRPDPALLPDAGEAVREIRDTVVHEIGHMLGWATRRCRTRGEVRVSHRSVACGQQRGS